MVYEGELFCPVCGGTLKLYDHVMRMIKIQKGVKTYIYIRRLRCTKCGRVHRELPEHIIPHIHYDKAIVNKIVLLKVTCMFLKVTILLKVCVGNSIRVNLMYLRRSTR